jgi:hypothetical protein
MVFLAAVDPPEQREAEAEESKNLVRKAHEVADHMDELVTKIERIDRLYRERLKGTRRKARGT